MASRVRARGLSRLQQQVDAMPRDVEVATERAAEEIAETLAYEIANDAPVDTGALRDSVRAEGDTVIIGEDYAEFVEDDQPFIQPNIDSVIRQGPKIVQESLRKEIG